MESNETIRAKEVCPTTTMGLIREGVLLVDVREPDEVAEVAFDVKDIMHIPFSEFENRWQEIPKDRDVVMACHEGARSLKTTYYLLNRGYDRVINMKLGMVRWVEKGFPVIGALNTASSCSCCGPADDSGKSSCC